MRILRIDLLLSMDYGYLGYSCNLVMIIFLTMTFSGSLGRRDEYFLAKVFAITPEWEKWNWYSPAMGSPSISIITVEVLTTFPFSYSIVFSSMLNIISARSPFLVVEIEKKDEQCTRLNLFS